MRFQTFIITAAAGTFTVLPGCASNSVPPASVPQARSELGFVPNRLSASTFREFDRNGDGFLSRDEARGSLSTYFDQLDTNRDGKLSPQELGIDPATVGQR